MAVTSIDSPISEYLTKDALACELGLSTRTLDRWSVLRIGPPRTRAGRAVLYSRTKVREWLESQTEELPAARA